MKRIDVHHHITPDLDVEKLGSIGITEAYGHAFPEWTPESSLSFMKKVGIDIAVMSVSTPGVCFKDELFSRNLARSCNEYMAETKRKYAGKFGGFASIPLTDKRGSFEELNYALDELKLDGVCLMTHYDGKYLGNKEFDEIFSELNRRKSVVYIHPTDPVGAYDPELGM